MSLSAMAVTLLIRSITDCADETTVVAAHLGSGPSQLGEEVALLEVVDAL